MTDERNRDFGGAPSRGPDPRGSDQGAADRRDAGADALLELARLIGQSDPFAPDGSKTASMPPPASMMSGAPPDARLANVSRAAAAQASRDPFVPPPPPTQERSYEDRGRREPGFGEPRVPVQSTLPDAGDGLNFLRRERDEYPVAPRPAADERDYDRGGRLQPAFGHEDHPDEYGEGGYAEAEYEAEPDDYDEDEHGGKRRRPTRMVMALLGLAVVGSVAAYGYRAFNAGPSGPTPIIRADNSPTKMTPMSDTKPESGRLGDRGGEQVVPRSEEPVDVGAYRPGNDAASQLPQDTTGGFMPNMVPSTPGAVSPPADTKRVQTVAINANPSRGGAGPAQTQPPSRQAAAPQPAPPPQRQAALAPVPAAADTTAAPPVESGGYVVQLSAVRSEADAQTAFRQLQAKYPMLGGRQPLIRRKDQGEKGIFFAAQVGPFGAKGDADQLCEQLKSAGGSCYVLRN